MRHLLTAWLLTGVLGFVVAFALDANGLIKYHHEEGLLTSNAVSEAGRISHQAL